MRRSRSFVRTGHGNGAGVPRIEVPPADELPVGVPAPARPPVPRDEAGRLRPGPGTAELAAEGGRARAASLQLARLLGLATLPEDHAHAPYARLAREWRDEHIRTLAATVGGGEVGPGPASIVSTAALQMAASRFLFDRGAETGSARTLLEASRLADSSRQSLLAAHSLAALEAEARRTTPHRPTAAIDWVELDRRQREQALALEPPDSPAFQPEPDEPEEAAP